MRRATDDAELRTTATSLEILRTLMDLDGARVTEVATHLDRPKSTVHNHLATLERAKFVVQEGDLYYPSLNITELGQYARSRKPEYDLAETYTERLHDVADLRSVFVVEEHGLGVFVHTKSGGHPDFRHERPGNQIYLHNTAVGKALLAAFPRERVEEILDRWGLPEITDYTITDRDDLFAELDDVRDRGYAYNREENVDGLHAVGTAVTARGGQVVGAFSVSGGARTLDGDRLERDAPDALLGVANEFELELELS